MKETIKKRIMSEQFELISPVTYDSGLSGPHLLIIAGVHGDEYEPILTVKRLGDNLNGNSFIVKGKLTLVPVVNGPANKRRDRTAVDGMDLARTCPGRSDGSLTEKIAWEISGLIRSADFLIDMHTGGSVFEIYPLSGYMLHSDREILEQQRRMARVFGLSVQWGTSPDLDGRTLSVARDAGIPAIYTEYGGGKSINPEIVDELYEGCLRIMAELNMIPTRENKNLMVDYTVEDHRKESGHLQIMYPSPMDGRFTSQMALGEIIKVGDLIGQVHDPDTDRVEEICAREDGLLFLIRRKANVKKGEATAGILPITQPGNRIVT